MEDRCIVNADGSQDCREEPDIGDRVMGELLGMPQRKKADADKKALHTERIEDNSDDDHQSGYSTRKLLPQSGHVKSSQHPSPQSPV